MYILQYEIVNNATVELSVRLGWISHQEIQRVEAGNDFLQCVRDVRYLLSCSLQPVDHVQLCTYSIQYVQEEFFVREIKAWVESDGVESWGYSRPIIQKERLKDLKSFYQISQRQHFPDCSFEALSLHEPSWEAHFCRPSTVALDLRHCHLLHS